MSVLYFLLMVGVLVTVHELGHFAAAKLCGVRVLTFSIGFGPALLRVRGPETEYRLGLIPLGGYVRMLGEDPSEAIAGEERERALSEKPLWKRLVVVFAGPAANLLCPLIIYFAFFAGHTELPAAVVGDVFADGPAAQAGIEPGDRVVEVNGQPVRYWQEFERIIDANTGRMLRLKLQRRGEEVYTYVAPRRHTIRGRAGERSEQGLIGITQAPFEPQIGVLDARSPAARAGLRTGDRIISVDGEPVDSYTRFSRLIATRTKRASLAFLRARHAAVGFADVQLMESAIADLVPDRLVQDRKPRAVTGFAPAELFVAQVEPGSPADRAGLRAGDLVTTLDGVPISHWLLFEQVLLADPDRAYRLGWRRARPGGGVEDHEAMVRQERRWVVDEYGQSQEHVVLGAVNDFRLGHGEMAPIEGRFGYAATHAVDHTADTIGLMARGLVALIGGSLPRDTVGGPIMMFRMASVSGEKGWDAFLLMLALISINLGLINLLPIPILDGGHLVMFAIEALGRRRLSPRVRDAMVLAGLAVIVSLTVLALRNDIVRYLMH